VTSQTGEGRIQSDGGLTIATVAVEGGMRLVPNGELDLASAPALRDALREAELSHDLVVLDLRELRFMDSTGLHVLIDADQRMRKQGRELTIVRGDSQVGRLLDLTHASSQLHVVAEPPPDHQG
jgi:anti-sigma B factor antagonist